MAQHPLCAVQDQRPPTPKLRSGVGHYWPPGRLGKGDNGRGPGVAHIQRSGQDEPPPTGQTAHLVYIGVNERPHAGNRLTHTVGSKRGIGP